MLATHKAGLWRLQPANSHIRRRVGVAAGDRGNRLASRGAPMPENLAGAVESLGGAWILHARSRSVARRSQPGRTWPFRNWSEGEVARVAKRAWRMGYYGLAAVIAVAWDTQLSPGDVRVLRASQLARGATGEVFFTARGPRQGSPLAVCSATALLRSSRHISSGLELNCTATPTSSAIGQALLIRATRSATISATCERLNSGPASVERLSTISGAAGRSRRS